MSFARDLLADLEPDPNERLPERTQETIILTPERRQRLRRQTWAEFQGALSAADENGGADIAALDRCIERIIALRNELAVLAPPSSQRHPSWRRVDAIDAQPQDGEATPPA